MQFRVASNKVTDNSSLPAQLRPVPRLPESEATKTRLLTLDEYEDKADESLLLLLNNSYWHDPITEKPALNSTEIWSFLNPTDDTHPIHLHTVRFQILDRQRYDPWTYDDEEGAATVWEHAFRPAPGEDGWKDVVRVSPKDGHAHYREVRQLSRPLRLALPHAGARRQRNDAALRDCGGVRLQRVEVCVTAQRWVVLLPNTFPPHLHSFTPQRAALHLLYNGRTIRPMNIQDARQEFPALDQQVFLDSACVSLAPATHGQQAARVPRHRRVLSVRLVHATSHRHGHDAQRRASADRQADQCRRR